MEIKQALFAYSAKCSIGMAIIGTSLVGFYVCLSEWPIGVLGWLKGAPSPLEEQEEGGCRTPKPSLIKIYFKLLIQVI